MARSTFVSGIALLVLLCAACSPATDGSTASKAGNGGSGPSIDLDGSPSSEPYGIETCEQAKAQHSYIGCEFWPTVVANLVFPIFDFTVVAANSGFEPAELTVTGPGGEWHATAPPNDLVKIYLPWVDDLKVWSRSDGKDGESLASVKVERGAYHLVSTRPVSVYQFSPLEYKSVGGPAGKSWSSGGDDATMGMDCSDGKCFSHSNDASLILPVGALTETYRVAGQRGQAKSAYFAITATEDNTDVSVTAGALGSIIGGVAIAATPAKGTLALSLGAGDVAELFAPPGEDPSGALVKASKPVQVIAGESCLAVPTATTPFCDHVEESVLPAEAQGRHYVVTTPTGPVGKAVGHVVRLYGSFDGTTLSYAPKTPTGAPATIAAGEVVDLGIVTEDFEVRGDQAFAVGTLMLSASLVSDAYYPAGDPSQSFAVPVEQYRKTYVFLAPDDYDQSYVDVIAPAGATLELDDAPIALSAAAIAGTDFELRRVTLAGGAHRLTSSEPVAIQVMGYGNATSYHYPGGSDYVRIAPPPVK